MAKRSSRVDDYIAKAAPFARPILQSIRAAFHAADAGVEETIKWGAPHFEKGGLLGHMAAFKAHVRLVFWRGKELKDPKNLLRDEKNEQLGWMRIESKADLPASEVLSQYVRDSIRLVAAGKAKLARPRSKAPRELQIPKELLDALKQNAKAKLAFEAFSYSHKKEYVEWIVEAKKEETRARRLETAIQWMSEGKSRNWKYEKC